MKQLFFIFLILPFTANAQLNQLEFDIEKATASSAKSAATPDIVNQMIQEETKIPKNAAEAEAMEREAIERAKNKSKTSASSAPSVAATSSSSGSETAARFNFSGDLVNLKPQDGSAQIPPRLKGPFVDESNDSAITSRQSWALPKNKDCGSVADEKSYIEKSIALKEMLYRFSGNTDYLDLAASNVCAKHCQEGFHIATPSDLRIEQGGSATFSVAVIGNACHYILEKQKEKPWKLIKAVGLVCNCFEASRAKPLLDAQVLDNK